MRIVICFLLMLFSVSSIYPFSNQPAKDCLNNNHRKAVTYTLDGGRFGDKFLNYLHAKWISYRYNIPLLYKPFPYSDQLMLHYAETPYTQDCLSEYAHMIKPSYKENINYESDLSALYVIPYFPECLWENTPHNGYYYISVDWEDEEFRKILKKLIKPLYIQPFLELPQDRITVAVHVRKGGGYDDRIVRIRTPLKLPPDSFYIDQIRQIYEILDKQPLYVYIFTDENEPLKLVEKYQHHLTGMDIQFDCRVTDNNHYSNVLEDFFEMTRFDCLIRPESNYSLVASKIADYRVMIKPVGFKRVENIQYNNLESLESSVFDDLVYINEVEVEILKEAPNVKERYRINYTGAKNPLSFKKGDEISLPARWNQDINYWWNGLYVAVIRK